jgi:hypothetical protein
MTDRDISKKGEHLFQKYIKNRNEGWGKLMIKRKLEEKREI